MPTPMQALLLLVLLTRRVVAVEVASFGREVCLEERHRMVMAVAMAVVVRVVILTGLFTRTRTGGMQCKVL